jgi:8-oxo-dGTP diphosphatase
VGDRFRSIVDVHLVLIRDGQVLLSRRANTGYADGLLNLVSGHLEEGEDVVSAVARETEEEIGIRLDREDLACVHVMHHRNSEGQARIGFFFQPARWEGEPVNREPHKCSELLWCLIDALPADMVAYPAAALCSIGKGQTFSLHGWSRSAGDEQGSSQ